MTVWAGGVPCGGEEQPDEPQDAGPAAREGLARALDWLQANQGPQGDWNTANPGVAGLAALASLAAGHAPARGSRGQIAQGAIDFITRSMVSGVQGIRADEADTQRDLAVAVLALTQAYGACDDPLIGQALDRAVRRMHRYLMAAVASGSPPESSILAWQALALESAVECGLSVPQEAPSAILRWTDSPSARQDTSGGTTRAAERSGGVPQQEGDLASPANGAEVVPGVVLLEETASRLVVWQALAPADPRRGQALGFVCAQLAAVCRDADGPGPSSSVELRIDPLILALVGFALAREQDDVARRHLQRLQQWLLQKQQRFPEDPLVHGSWRGSAALGQPSAAATSAAALVLAMHERLLPVLP
jgi:hypothetical protein